MCNVAQGMQSSFDGEMVHVLAAAGLSVSLVRRKKRDMERTVGSEATLIAYAIEKIGARTPFLVRHEKIENRVWRSVAARWISSHMPEIWGTIQFISYAAVASGTT